MDKCKVCGCTDNKACDGGCWWVAEGLCSQCATKLIEENKKLKQWDKNKDTRNSRQRVSNAKLIKENKKYKDKFNKINTFMQETAKAEEDNGFFDGAEAYIFAQLQSIIKED